MSTLYAIYDKTRILPHLQSCRCMETQELGEDERAFYDKNWILPHLRSCRCMETQELGEMSTLFMKQPCIQCSECADRF
jgi:hypothetical protein